MRALNEALGAPGAIPAGGRSGEQTVAASPRPASTPEPKRICLCAIVRNEARTIGRCLEAAAPVIDAVSICDTGSTDDTVALAREWIRGQGLPGRVVEHPWRDFGHNRTRAIGVARALIDELGWTAEESYLLFLDADMMLQVEPGFVRDHLTAPVHTLVQRNAGLVYPNVRLMRADVDGSFVGATHEHFRDPTGTPPVPLDGLSIDDLNDGGCRADKLERDIRLLEAELEAQPQTSRSMFYLAQSYRGTGDFGKALYWYQRRIAAGGWAEEVWYSHYAIGLMHLETDDLRRGTRALHAAIRLRPERPEPWARLAAHHRTHGRPRLALGYARRGLAEARPSPSDLFSEIGCHPWWLLYELSIAGFEPDHHAAADAAERVSLSPGAPPGLADLAGNNQPFYAEQLPAAEMLRIAPTLPAAYRPCNPSIVPTDHGYTVACRAVSYRIDALQRFVPSEADGVARTRTVLVHTDRDLRFLDQHDVEIPIEPARESNGRGLEDARLVGFGEGWGLIGYSWDLHPRDAHRMTWVELGRDGRYRRHVHLHGHGDDRPQKHWLPWIDPATGELHALYSYQPTTLLAIDLETGRCRPWIEHETTRPLQRWRGSAAPIALPAAAGGGRLVIVHEVALLGLRYYLHRLVRVDDDWRIVAASSPFFLRQRGIEFVAGACLDHQERDLLVTFGVDDREAWIARLPLERALEMLHSLPG